VVDVMKDNVEKVLERDVNLSQLNNRAGMFNKRKKQRFSRRYYLDMLQTGAAQFTTNARDLKRKYWWKNLKVSFVFFS
jgi:hypothetical protein